MTAVRGAPGDRVRPSLLGRGSVYLLGTICQVAGSFLALPLLTRVLDASAFGLVATAVVVTQVTRVLAEGGLASVVTLEYFGEGGVDRARRLAGLAIAFGLILTTGVHLTGPLWVQVFDGLSYGAPLVLAVWAAPVLVALVAGQAVLRAEGRALSFVGTAAMATVGAQVVGIAAAVLTEPTATAYLGGVLLGYLSGAVVACWLARVRFDVWRHPSEIRGAVPLAWPSVPHGLALYVLQAGDRVVIQRVDGFTAVGRYQVAYLVGAAVLSALSAVNNAWAPLVYSTPPDQRRDTVAETAGVLLRLSAYAVAGVALVAPFLLHVVAPASYQPETLVAVTAIVGLAAIPYCLYLAGVHLVFSSRQTRILALATPVAALVNIGLNAVLIPLIGLEGAALATVCAYALQALLVRRGAGGIGRGLGVGGARRSALVALSGVAVAIVLPVEGWGAMVRLVMLVGLVIVFASAVHRAGASVDSALGRRRRPVVGAIPPGRC